MLRDFATRRSRWLPILLLVLAHSAATALGEGRPNRRKRLMFVALSDSLGHGTMDGVNNFVNTRNGFVQLVANALGRERPVYFRQPFFSEEEKRLRPFIIPSNLSVDGSDLFSLEGRDYYKRAGTLTSELSTSLLADRPLPYWLDDKYDKVIYPINLFTGRATSQLDGAIWLIDRFAPAIRIQETAVLVWIGNNDTSTAALGIGGNMPEFQPLPLDEIASELRPLLRLLLRFGERAGEVSFEPYATWAIERNMTTVDDFVAQYERILSRLRAETAASGVHQQIFLLTLPYYSAVGYLMDSEDIEFYLQKSDPAYTVPASFRRVAAPGEPITDPLRGDRISLLTFGFMIAMLETGHTIADVNRVLELDGKQRDGLVMSEDEQARIRNRIDAFNEAIAYIAETHGPNVRLIDLGGLINAAFLNDIQIVAGGRVLSRKIFRGSAFSADGVHPGYTAQALLANVILEEMSGPLKVAPALYDLDEVSLSDPYVDRDGDGWVPGPDYEPTGVAELLFLLLDPDDADADVQVSFSDDVWDRISNVLLRQILEIGTIRAEAERLREVR